MRKIEKVENWLTGHLSILKCPVCGDQFVAVVNNQLVCKSGHSININKHGFVYFLDKGNQNDYDRDMLLDRRKLLEAGLFDGIIKHLEQEMPDQSQSILDVGTGEGTPLYKLSQLMAVPPKICVGFDISKDGIQLATQLSSDIFYCVADLRHLPFVDHSFSSIIELFSPADYQEFKRLLQPHGSVYKVIPTANYLIELRDLLYSTSDNHRTYDNSAVKQRFEEQFSYTKDINIKYKFKVKPELRSALLHMSPLHWGKSAKRLEATDLASLTSVTVDVDLLIGKLN